MKKLLILALAITASSTTFAFSQEGDNFVGRRGANPFLAEARTEDGKIELAKLPEQMPQERKDTLKAADKDGDGFLTQEEFRAVAPGFFNRGQRPNAPQFWGPEQGFGNFAAPDAMKDGKIELAKLPEQMPQDRKDMLKAADKDGDGFVTFEEMRANMPRPNFEFPEGKKPEFLNDDNAIVIDKFVEAIKTADKNNDGVINDEEQKALAEVIREKYGFCAAMYAQTILGLPQGPGMGMGQPGMGPGKGMGPGMGMGQPGMGPGKGMGPGMGMGQPGMGPGKNMEGPNFPCPCCGEKCPCMDQFPGQGPNKDMGQKRPGKGADKGKGPQKNGKGPGKGQRDNDR